MRYACPCSGSPAGQAHLVPGQRRECGALVLQQQQAAARAQHARHLAQRRARLREYAQAERVHHAVEGRIRIGQRGDVACAALPSEVQPSCQQSVTRNKPRNRAAAVHGITASRACKAAPHRGPKAPGTCDTPCCRTMGSLSASALSRACSAAGQQSEAHVSPRSQGRVDKGA